MSTPPSAVGDLAAGARARGPLARSAQPGQRAARPRAARVGRWAARALAVGALMLGAGSAAPGAAVAHSELASSDPPQGAVLEAVPSTVTLTFNQAIEPDFATVVITQDSGEPVPAQVSEVDGPTLTATVAEPAEGRGSGGFTLAYRVVSADGHPITGESSFEVTAPAPPATAAQTAPPADTAATPAQTADPDAGAPDAGAAADTGTAEAVPGWLPLVAAGMMLLGATGSALALRARSKRVVSDRGAL